MTSMRLAQFVLCFVAPFVAASSASGQEDSVGPTTVHLVQRSARQLPDSISVMGATLRGDGSIMLWTPRSVVSVASTGSLRVLNFGPISPVALARNGAIWEIVDSFRPSIMKVGRDERLIARTDLELPGPLLSAARSGCGWAIHFRSSSGEPVVALVNDQGHQEWALSLPDWEGADAAPGTPSLLLGGADTAVYILQRAAPFRLARASCAGVLYSLSTEPIGAKNGRWAAIAVVPTPVGLLLTYSDFASDQRVVRREPMDGGRGNDLELNVPLAIVSAAGTSVLAIRRTDRIEAVVYEIRP